MQKTPQEDFISAVSMTPWTLLDLSRPAPRAPTKRSRCACKYLGKGAGSRQGACAWRPAKTTPRIPKGPVARGVRQPGRRPDHAVDLMYQEWRRLHHQHAEDSGTPCTSTPASARAYVSNEPPGSCRPRVVADLMQMITVPSHPR